MSLRWKNWTVYIDPDTGVKMEGDQEAVQNFRKYCEEHKKRKQEWIEWLKQYGVKAAHPDDGWHDRENYEVQLCYPSFEEKIEIGDKIALGDPDHFTVVTVDSIRQKFFGGTVFHYKR